LTQPNDPHEFDHIDRGYPELIDLFNAIPDIILGVLLLIVIGAAALAILSFAL
jgi:hypothetical protein